VRRNPARYDFSGRVAVVTGGMQGIGAAIAEHFRRSGAEVAVWDRGVPEDTSDRHLIRTDVTDVEAVGRSLGETLARFERVDILVNNAGYAGATVPLAEYDPAEWRRIIDVNLNGAFHVSRSVVPIMTANGWGRIVNVASLAGKEGTPNSSAYSAAKAGVLAMTKALGKELAGSGVLVNAIAPAAVKTTLLDQMSPDHVETMIRKSPMGRLGTTDEVAELTL
jgi:2-dehydro-3-deoxy-L-rhamnonate dehydrogenase (NAD+)